MSNIEVSRKITGVIASGQKHFARKGNITIEFFISVCGNPLAKVYQNSKLIKTCRGVSNASVKEVAGFVRSVLDAF